MLKEEEQKFIIRGVSDAVVGEGDEVECLPPLLLHYHTPDKRIEQIKLRQIKSVMAYDVGSPELCTVKGLWIEDGYLIPVQSEHDQEEELFNHGKHLRTFTLVVSGDAVDWEVSLSEFENVVQYAVNNLDAMGNRNLFASGYVSNIQFGTLKHIFDMCVSSKDISNFINVAEEVRKK